MKIAFFEIKNWEAEYLKTKLTNVQLVFSEKILDINNLPEQRDFDCISIFTDSKIDKAVIDAFPNLKLIATRTTGMDHIDQEATKAKGIAVKNVPTYGENTVSEYTFALILSLSRKITLAVDKVKEKNRFSSEGLEGFDLFGKTIGVVGSGHIGRNVIKIANGFGMKAVVFDAFPDKNLENQLNFRFVSFEDLLKNSDIITFHIPYLPSTHHLINKENIGLIKKGAILINTARGAIVETAAVVEALNKNILSGAALDVLEEETNLKNEKNLIMERELDDSDLRTILENHVLIGMENVIVTPHNAFNSREALTRILDTTITNILPLAH